jgi:hypothetical protein
MVMARGEEFRPNRTLSRESHKTILLRISHTTAHKTAFFSIAMTMPLPAAYT